MHLHLFLVSIIASIIAPQSAILHLLVLTALDSLMRLIGVVLLVLVII
jgi:hypothetical protein